MVGVSLCISTAKEPEFNSDIEGKLSEKFDPILDILGQVGDGYHQENEVHLFTTAVNHKFTGHRLASNLKVADQVLARKHGFSQIVTESTGIASIKASMNSGMEKKKTIEYKTYQYKGKYPFAHL